MNDTEAPTSGSTEENLELTISNPLLNEEQNWFVSFIHQHYGMMGKLMTVTEAVSEYGFTEREFEELMTNTNVRDALVERGVVKERIKKNPPVGKVTAPEKEPEWVSHALSPMQLLVANTLLDLVDTRSHKKKLQDLGVSTATYNTWLKDENFQNYLRERAESLIGESQHEAMLALIDKVRMGDMNAIKYYHELIGRYVEQKAGNTGGAASPDAIRNLLVSILEIIQDEVDDPNVSLRISERFKNLINAHSMAGQMLEAQNTIEMPEVARTRELTPTLKKLMESGEGYE